VGWAAAVALVVLLAFGAGSAFGRLTAPTSAAAAGPTASQPVAITTSTASPKDPAAPGTTTPGSSGSPAPATSAAAPTPSPSHPVATPLPEGQTPDWSLLDEAYTQLRKNYVDPSALDPNILEQGAIRGMLDALDDRGHTGYLTPGEVKARDDSLNGTFVGIGVVLDDRAGPITIARVLPNSPALEGGIVVGDTIVAVDGNSVEGQKVEQIVTKVRGQEGTPVRITLEGTDGAQRTLSLVRRRINLPLVSWGFAPGTKQAVVRLESFSSGASAAVVAALKEARAQGATGIVFDLRGNPGGYVDEAVKTASQFLSSGTVYVSADRSGKQTTHTVIPGGFATDIPLVVLVDGQTASSAEIVTGALQDAGRAKVLGTTTYGTGTVVGTFPLADGSAVTIGIERWLTPKGHAIWREGLTPDQVVPLPTKVTYVTPDTFSALGTAGIAGSQDGQLKAALDALSALVPPSAP
jgi:carboxyl-terminal processing protease